MRFSLRLCYIAPGGIPPRAGVLDALRYLSQPVPDLNVRLDPEISRIQFLIQTFQDGNRKNGRKIHHATDECRFASPGKIPAEHRRFPMHQFSFQNPDVLIEFKNRNSTDPARETEVDDQPIEPTDEAALLERERRQQEIAQREKIINQEEFVDVYFAGNPTPLRLNITELSPTDTIRLLTSVIPPPSTSTTSAGDVPSPDTTSDIATTSPSEPSPSIPLGEGPELWEHVWRTRSNPDGALDLTEYVWRGGERQKFMSRDELIAMGKPVRGPGEPGAKRKWTDGVCDPMYGKPPKSNLQL